MHSSISNSDFENEYQTLDPSGVFKVRIKAAIAGIVISVLVVGGFLQLTKLINLNGRVLGMMSYLPVFIEENRERQKMMVFGSSMVQAGFEPYLFDGQLAGEGIDVASINYGVGNLDPEFQQYIARQVREDLSASGQKLNLTLLEFNPFQTTIARGQFGDITRDQNEAILLTPAQLWNITLEDPNRGIRLFNIRYLRNGISAQLLSSIFTIADADEISGNEEARQEAADHRDGLGDVFEAALPEGVAVFNGDYSKPLRGGRVDKRVFSEEAMDAMENYLDSFREPYRMEADQFRRIVQGDILELGFDESLIKAFINMVNDLNAVSKQMEVVLLPRNTDWIVYSPEVQQKLNLLMARITLETGVKVRDFQDHPSITPEMFFDTTHLSFGSGIDAYTRLLADVYKDRFEVQ